MNKFFLVPSIHVQHHQLISQLSTSICHNSQYATWSGGMVMMMTPQLQLYHQFQFQFQFQNSLLLLLIHQLTCLPLLSFLSCHLFHHLLQYPFIAHSVFHVLLENGGLWNMQYNQKLNHQWFGLMMRKMRLTINMQTQSLGQNLAPTSRACMALSQIIGEMLLYLSTTLIENGNWEIVDLPPGEKTIGSGVRIQTGLLGADCAAGHWGWLEAVKWELDVFRWVPTGEHPEGTWGLYTERRVNKGQMKGTRRNDYRVPWNDYIMEVWYYRVRVEETEKSYHTCESVWVTSW